MPFTVYCLPDFLVAPPETVLIPEGGDANISCSYVDLQATLQIAIFYNHAQDCSCYAGAHEDLLRFINFTIAGVGEYFCAVTAFPGPRIEDCKFNVKLAGN